MITSLWTAAHPVFADVHRLEIQSGSLVGALPGAELAPAVRLDPPDLVDTVAAAAATPDAPVAATPVAPIVNKSNCRSDLAGPVMTIQIADISYSCPVYAGGQKMLNSGAVTQITDDAIASVLADYPGGPGVLWIAAHRSSHGGAFAAVPNLADGALVTMSDGTHTATYRIVGRIYVTINERPGRRFHRDTPPAQRPWTRSSDRITAASEPPVCCCRPAMAMITAG